MMRLAVKLPPVAIDVVPVPPMLPTCCDVPVTSKPAAAVLLALDDSALDHCLAAHLSAERSHRHALKLLGKVPLLDLGMRLGEGSGAALAVGIVKAAVACHNGMATFAEAGVAGKEEP